MLLEFLPQSLPLCRSSKPAPALLLRVMLREEVVGRERNRARAREQRHDCAGRHGATL
jgi:hypothetical protein